jgi:hypothetical protein
MPPISARPCAARRPSSVPRPRASPMRSPKGGAAAGSDPLAPSSPSATLPPPSGGHAIAGHQRPWPEAWRSLPAQGSRACSAPAGSRRSARRGKAQALTRMAPREPASLPAPGRRSVFRRRCAPAPPLTATSPAATPKRSPAPPSPLQPAPLSDPFGESTISPPPSISRRHWVRARSRRCGRPGGASRSRWRRRNVVRGNWGVYCQNGPRSPTRSEPRRARPT